MDPLRVQRKALGRSAPGRSRKASRRRRQRSHLRPKWPESADSEKGVPGGRRADPCEVLRTGPGTQHALTSRRLGHARMHSRTHSADILGSAKHQGHRGNTRDRPPRLRSGETIKQWINKCVSAGRPRQAHREGEAVIVRRFYSPPGRAVCVFPPTQRRRTPTPPLPAQRRRERSRGPSDTNRGVTSHPHRRGSVAGGLQTPFPDT